MNAEYISRALCFHGQPLQKIWADERGANDLQNCGVTEQNSYPIYLERQKYFTFQDRAKRLKLHQFFSRKAIDLYDRTLRGPYLGSETERIQQLENARPYVATLPPYELFTGKNQEKFKRLHCLLEGLEPGDIIYGIVTKALYIYPQPLAIKPLCTAEPKVRHLGDVTLKAMIPAVFLKPAIDKKGNTKNYNINDFVCCEILDVSVDSDRINLTMESNFSKNKNVKFGLVSAEELPAYYRVANNHVSEKYSSFLFKSKEFLNPNYDVLFELNGLDVNDNFTLMQSLKKPFPRSDYAKELRQAQASKWAFRSVAEGIEHFKIGRHIEAFQCLNKALSIDPRNVEGLVARGALYANKGSFLKAVDDFEKALTLNSYHVNARKYMGETLVALGRSYEEDNRFEDALKAYMDCLNIIPNHEQARLSLETLQQRPGSQHFDDFLNIPGTGHIDLNIRHKKKHLTSNSSGSSSSGSGSSGSESDTDSNNSEKLHSHQKKDISLSPLSKRMAAQASGGVSTSMSLSSNKNQFSQPFYLANQSSSDLPTTSNILRNPNEFRLDDDDTESRVRKLLQDASKYKKEKKKSKKKKSKKSKKENRKEKTVATTLLKNFEKIDFKDAFQAIAGLQVQSKLNENLQLYEQTIAQIKKRQELLEQSTSSTNRLLQNSGPYSPPPVAPSMSFEEDQVPPPPPSIKGSFSGASALFSNTSHIPAKEETPRFSFTIKRPVKVDKFGLVRIATPLDTGNKNSPTKSRSRSRSTSRTGSKRHSPSRSDYSKSRDSRHSRHRSRSRSFDRHRRRSSRSRSRSNSRRRRRSGSRSGLGRGGRFGRRRTPSPFVPRGTPPPRRRSRDRSRKHSPTSRTGVGAGPAYGNRVWKRPGYTPGDAKSDRWQHDKFDEKSADDGPTIEEIDEIINKAQRERKEEIIKRDKNILKKPI